MLLVEYALSVQAMIHIFHFVIVNILSLHGCATKLLILIMCLLKFEQKNKDILKDPLILIH